MTLKWKRASKTEFERAIWLVHRTDTNVLGFWLCQRSELSGTTNQPILRFYVIQHSWPIEQCLFHIRVFFCGKTKRPCFDLFIHWLIKQIKKTYRNHFSRSYKNCSTWVRVSLLKSKSGSLIRKRIIPFFPKIQKRIFLSKWSTTEVDSLDHIQNRILWIHDPKRFLTKDPKRVNTATSG